MAVGRSGVTPSCAIHRTFGAQNVAAIYRCPTVTSALSFFGILRTWIANTAPSFRWRTFSFHRHLLCSQTILKDYVHKDEQALCSLLAAAGSGPGFSSGKTVNRPSDSLLHFGLNLETLWMHSPVQCAMFHCVRRYVLGSRPISGDSVFYSLWLGQQQQ